MGNKAIESKTYMIIMIHTSGANRARLLINCYEYKGYYDT